MLLKLEKSIKERVRRRANMEVEDIEVNGIQEISSNASKPLTQINSQPLAEIDEKTNIIREILAVYRIYRPKYDLKDDDEKERIVA